MTVFRTSVGSGDLARLAELHVATLPTSLISRFGLGYARAFYRYVVRSDRELLCLERDQAGALQAGLVVSFDPGSLDRRLLLETPLLLAAALRPWRVPLKHIVRDLWSGDTGEDLAGHRPELIIIFVDPACQGRGVGAKLIRQCETALIERRISSYTVKTEDQPHNRALAFYSRNGFRLLGRVERHGVAFAVFEKELPDQSLGS